MNSSEERHAKEGPGCVGVNVVHLSVGSGVRERPHEHACHSRVTGTRLMLESYSAPSRAPCALQHFPLAVCSAHGSIYMSML